MPLLPPLFKDTTDYRIGSKVTPVQEKEECPIRAFNVGEWLPNSKTSSVKGKQPTLVGANGYMEWQNAMGELHREDGPAVIWSDGTQFWWVNGKQHRLDGPAGIYSDGSQCWWVNGKQHRLDGPAVIGADGSQEWWVNDKFYYYNKSFQKAAKITDEEMSFLIIKFGNVT